MAISSREMLLILRARDEASQVLRSVGGSVAGLSAEAEKAARSQIASGAAIATVGVSLAYVGLQAIQFLNNATNAAVEYNRQSALTLTQVDQLGVKLETIKNIGKEVAGQVPTDFKKIQTSLYDIFSSMDVSIPEAKVLLTEFSKASVAGQVDLQDASRATIGILNAYGLKAKDVNVVNDIMFQLVRKGVGTYGEFASTIGRAVPSAVRAHQSISELAGMMAFLTRNGLSAAMASASAGRALDAISNPKTIDHFDDLGKIIGSIIGKKEAVELYGSGWKKLAVHIRDSNGEIRPMTAIMTDLGKALSKLPSADRANVLYELFKSSGGTIQARRFFDIAIKQYGQFNDLTNDMINSSGALGQAYDTMFNTPAMQVQLLSNKFEILKTEVGDYILPLKEKLVQWALAILTAWEKLSPETQKLIVQITAIAGAALVIIGVIMAIVGIFLMFAGAAALAGTSIGAILTPIGIVIAVLALLGAAVYYVWQNHQMLWDLAKRVWADILKFLEPVIGFFKALWEVIAAALIPAFEDMWDKLVKGFAPAQETIGKLWASMQDAWQKIEKAFGPVLPKLLEGLKVLGIIIGVFLLGVLAAFVGAILIAANVLGEVLPPVIGFIADVINNLIQIFEGLGKFIVGFATGNWALGLEGMKQVVYNIFALIGNIVKDAWGILVGLFWGIVRGIKAVWDWLADVLVGHSIIPDMVNAIIDWFKRLPGAILNAISGFASSLVKWATDAMKRSWDAIVQGGVNIVTYAQGLPNRILNALGNTGQILYNAGWNFMVGLYNGLVGMGNKVIQYVEGLAQKVRNLWPFSPAKAGPLRDHPMDEAGANMMRMLGQGIQSNRDLVLNSMKSIAYDVASTPFSPPPVGGASGGPGGNNGSGNIYQHFEITTQEIDPTKHSADLGFEIARRSGY